VRAEHRRIQGDHHSASGGRIWRFSHPIPPRSGFVQGREVAVEGRGVAMEGREGAVEGREVAVERREGAMEE
jgi:hypothetical protein